MEYRPTWIRLVIQPIIKRYAKSILLTTMIGVGIGMMGYINGIRRLHIAMRFSWPVVWYLAGGLSRLAAGEDWNTFQMLYAESFHDMSPSERVTLEKLIKSHYRIPKNHERKN